MTLADLIKGKGYTQYTFASKFFNIPSEKSGKGYSKDLQSKRFSVVRMIRNYKNLRVMEYRELAKTLNMKLNELIDCLELLK